MDRVENYLTGDAQAEEKKPSYWLGVAHLRSDFDAYMGMWMLKTHVVPQGDIFNVIFVPSGMKATLEQCVRYDEELGQTVPYDEDKIIHVDTGGGPFDQHGKRLERSSSTKLLADHYNLWDQPGTKDFVELTVASDNIEVRYPLSLHRILKGLWYNHQHLVEGTDNKYEVDWYACLVEAYRLIDNCYTDYYYQYKSALMWEEMKLRMTKTFENGRTLANLWKFPRLRELAFVDKADVALYFQTKVPLKDMGDLFYPLIQVRMESALQHDKKSGISLDKLIVELRKAEATKRRVSTTGMDLGQLAPIPGLGEWYLHDSDNFICCGSMTHPLLNGDEYTRLTMKEISKIVGNYVVALRPEEKSAPKPAVLKTKPADTKKTAPKKVVAKKKAAKKKKM